MTHLFMAVLPKTTLFTVEKAFSMINKVENANGIDMINSKNYHVSIIRHGVDMSGK